MLDEVLLSMHSRRHQGPGKEKERIIMMFKRHSMQTLWAWFSHIKNFSGGIFSVWYMIGSKSKKKNKEIWQREEREYLNKG